MEERPTQPVAESISSASNAIPAEVAKKKKPSSRLGCFIVIIFLLLSAYQSYRTYFFGFTDSDVPLVVEEPVGEELPPIETPKTTPVIPKTTKPKTPTAQSTAVIVDPSTRKASLINFFVELSVYLQDKSHEMFVTRWTKPQVAVGVGEGTFDSTLNSCLNTYISDFNGVSSSIKLVRDDTVALGLPNVKIYYWPDPQFKERGGADSNHGFVEWIHNDDKSLKRSVMFLSESVMTLDEAVRCQVVRHEMTHAIGFWGHSDIFPESITSFAKTRYLYPEEDKIIIRMLYNSGIPIGLKETEVRTFFESNFNY